VREVAEPVSRSYYRGVSTADEELRAIRWELGQLAARVDRLQREMRGAPDAPAPPGPSEASAPVAPPRASAETVDDAIRRRLGLPSAGGRFSAPRTAAESARTTAQLESHIGAHWLNRIGIAAVLIGVAYFLKYAFVNNWIGPAGRIAIGLFAGILVITWSERFRRKGYKLFSYGLKAVGVGTLYLSLWASFALYHLVGSGVAGLAMFVVTASTVAMALAQDAEILAAFALVGGFVTPLLLSTGENKELQLFSYVALLDVASVVLVARKPWRRLLAFSFIGTVFLYSGWYTEFYDLSQLTPTMIFAALFFVIFAAAPLLARKPEHEDKAFAQLMLALVLANAVVYFAQVYLMMELIAKPETAWFALALAAAYIALSRLTAERAPDPEIAGRLRFLHLAIAIGFVTIAIPIRLDEHWITIGWAVEAAALLWVGERIGSRMVTGFGAAALALAILRLVGIDDTRTMTHLLNARLATNAVVIAVLGLLVRATGTRTDENGRLVHRAAIVVLNALAVLALSLEVRDHFAFERRDGTMAGDERQGLHMQEAFSYSALWMAYGGMLMTVGFWRRSATVRWLGLLLIAGTIAKVFLFDVSELDRVYRVAAFTVLGALLLTISFVYQRGWLDIGGDKAPPGA
jgi:uncharacterized membrane protein